MDVKVYMSNKRKIAPHLPSRDSLPHSLCRSLRRSDASVTSGRSGWNDVDDGGGVWT